MISFSIYVTHLNIFTGFLWYHILIMATAEQLDSSIEVIMELNGSQQLQNDSLQEKLVVEESPNEGVCRLCAIHGKGVDMLLKENSSVRQVVKHYLHLEVETIY
jgi:hypothetical protein